MSESTIWTEPSQRWLLSRYLVACLGARSADEGARVSLMLLALQQTGSAAVGAAMISALLVPHVVAAPLVGALIDRARRPRWVLGTFVVIFAGALLLVALLLGRVPLWVVFVLLVVGGCCGPAITGGLTSQLPALIGGPRTPRAFGLDSLFYNIASMAGPALAGTTAAVVNPVAAQSVLAACAALGAAGIAALPILPHHPSKRARPSLLSGATEILREPTLRVVTVSSTLGQLGPGAFPVVAAVLATSLNRTATSGLLLTAVAAGSFIGSLLWTWHPVAARRSPVVMTVSMVGIGAPIALTAVTHSMPATAVLFGASGFFIGPFGSALFTARTRYCAEAVRTQVFTIGAGLKVTASALGAALIGLVTELPAGTLLLLVSSSPILAGVLGTMLLLTRPLSNEQTATAATFPARRTNTTPTTCRKPLVPFDV